MLIEFDLAGAEWVLCAYLSGDQNMIDVVLSGKSPHVCTGALIAGASEEFVEEEHKIVQNNTDPDTIRELRLGLNVPKGIFLPRSMSIRQAGKKSNHALNYYMRYRRFALENEMPETDAKPLVEAYSTKAYPGIQDYWEQTREELRNNGRVLMNPFGRKVRLLGEWGPELFMAAYSFKPQSTVFDVARVGMCAAFRDTRKSFRYAKLAAQVHDSVLYDYENHDPGYMWAFCYEMMTNVMRPSLVVTDPKGTARQFCLGVDCKAGWDWGHMHPIKSQGDLKELLSHPPSREPNQFRTSQPQRAEVDHTSP
jgi:DNA polymerase family A